MRVPTSCLLALLALAGCQGSGDPPPPGGPCSPTCAGGPPPPYVGLADAQKAFTRQSADETLHATLEDASWLRFKGDPATVEQAHRAYFEYGYTSFQVLLRAKEFSQPTREEFVLEDSSGARLTGRPVSYDGSLKPVGDRWEYRFALSFQHSLGRDLRWLRLTRSSDGATVEWTFPEA